MRKNQNTMKTYKGVVVAVVNALLVLMLLDVWQMCYSISANMFTRVARNSITIVASPSSNEVGEVPRTVKNN